MRTLSTLALIAMCCLAASGQSRIYVSNQSTGANNGQNWANAYPDLSVALQSAQAGDSVWVAAGEYRPTSTTDRNISFNLKSGVRLYGGFKGNEQQLTERNWAANQTVLSGDIGAPGDSTDNSFTILFAKNADSSTIIDGFVFRFGNASGDSSGLPSYSPDRCGGALYLEGHDGICYADIVHCRFEHNAARLGGGAVYINGRGIGSVAPRFLFCDFVSNSAGQDGGGILRVGGSWAERVPDVGNCRFIGNNGGTVGGGGYSLLDSERTDAYEIIDSEFSINTGYNANACFLRFYRAEGSIVMVKRSNFKRTSNKNNTDFLVQPLSFSPLKCVELDSVNFFMAEYAQSPFIGYYILFNALTLSELGNGRTVFEISNSSFQNAPNRSLILESDSTRISNCLWLSNKSSSFGISSKYYAYMKNNVFKNNTISQYSTYIIEDPDNTGFVNTLLENNLFISNYNDQTKATKIDALSIGGRPDQRFIHLNSTFLNNTYSLPVDDPTPFWNTITSFKNCYFSERSLDFFRYSVGAKHPDSDSLRFINCAFEPPLDSLKAPDGTALSPGCLFGVADPMFFDTAAGNYRLRPCSPLINAGENMAWANQTNPTDFDGNPRIADGLVDIGPFETKPIAFPVAPKIAASCDSLVGGAVGFSADGGCPPFQFFWKKGTATGTDTTHLAPGNYQFTLTDSRGKTATATVEIPGSDIAVGIAGDPVFCADEPGVLLEATVAGGSDPVVFEWNTGETGLFLQNAGDGLFVFTATDAAGCTGLDSFLVEKSLETVGQFTVNDATGPTVADGSIILNLISGQPPFLFAWSNGDSTGNPQKLAPGPYSITITNADGCAVSYDFVVGFTIKTDGAAAGDSPGFYPNPASSRLFVEWGGIDLLEIFDQKGGLVLSKKRSAGAENFGLEGLADGAYRAVFSKNGAQSSAKPLIIRH